MAARSCAECGGDVLARRSDAIYCGKACKKRAHNRRVGHSAKETARVAARRAKARAGLRCRACGAPFAACRSDQRFCSQECLHRDHYQANRDRYIRSAATWRKNNPEAVAEIGRRFRAGMVDDPARMATLRESRRRSEGKRRAAIAGAVTGAVSREAVRARIAYYGGLCWICRSAPWEHMDHVKPLAKGGAHMPSNLRPACAACNSSKKDRWPFDPPLRRRLL